MKISQPYSIVYTSLIVHNPVDYSDHSNVGVVDTGNADDRMPYLTLSYANGPGYYYHRNLNDANRKNLTGIPTSKFCDINFIPNN